MITAGDRRYNGGVYIEPIPGDDISGVSRDAWQISMAKKLPCQFSFNGITLTSYGFVGQSPSELVDLYYYRSGIKKPDEVTS